MKNKLRALALAAGMVTLVSAPALAQGQEHRGHHGDHAGHGQHRGEIRANDDASAMPGMGDCPMMPGMMRGQGMMQMHRMHSGAETAHDHAAASDADMSASSIAFRAVNEAMHHGMDIAMTGDADVDFVRGMIAHHIGAVDMARIVQIFGSDPEIAALAEEIITAQEAEIAMMRDWLARNAPDHAQ